MAAEAAVEENGRVDSLATCQYVTFEVADEVLAVDIQPVQEIIRVPAVTRVPLAPATLDGLANLRGQVLPIVSLRRLLGLPDRAYDDATRAVVIDLGQPLGFVVDRVLSVLTVEADRIEPVHRIQSAIRADFLQGLLRDAGNRPLTLVVDFPQLIKASFEAVGSKPSRTLAAAALAVPEEADVEASDERQLVSFTVHGQEYAIAIEDVHEIVQMPEHIVEIPGSGPHVLGVMPLRERLLPLVSMRGLLGFGSAPGTRGRVVVVATATGILGLVTDSVNAVLTVAERAIEPLPESLRQAAGGARVDAICRLDGNRLLSIVKAEALLQQLSLTEVLAHMDTAARDTAADLQAEGDEHPDEEEQLVVFRLGSEEFGVPIAAVQEIVRVPEALTRVPAAPAFVEGVINLRGSVLPVLDLRRRLNMGTTQRSDRQRVMVFLLDGVRTGFIVDAVTEVLKIPRNALEPAPRLSPEQGALLPMVANLAQARRIIQILDPNELLRSAQVAALSELSLEVVGDDSGLGG